MRNWIYLHVFLRIRYFFIRDILTDLAAIRAQLAAVEDLTAMSKNIETALLTIAAHADDMKKPQGNPINLQRPSA
jgi:hypothetical protein